MTKNDLARELAVSEKLHLSTAVKAVDGLLRIVKESLVKGDDIFLRGFGTIAVVNREERPARDFKTGEAITIPAHRTVKIKVSPELKDAMNSSSQSDALPHNQS